MTEATVTASDLTNDPEMIGRLEWAYRKFAEWCGDTAMGSDYGLDGYRLVWEGTTTLLYPHLRKEDLPEEQRWMFNDGIKGSLPEALWSHTTPDAVFAYLKDGFPGTWAGYKREVESTFSEDD